MPSMSQPQMQSTGNPQVFAEYLENKPPKRLYDGKVRRRLSVSVGAEKDTARPRMPRENTASFVMLALGLPHKFPG